MRYIIAILAILVASPAWADCKQSDLKGTYQTFVIGADQGNVVTQTCTLIVRDNGRLRRPMPCRFFISGGGNGKAKLVGGRFTVSDNCQVKGFLKSLTGRTEVSARVSADGHVLAGLARGSGVVWQFTAIKHP